MRFEFSLNDEIYFIAEAGLNHNGEIGLAHELIEVAHRAGAHAIKFQKRTISELATREVLASNDTRFPFLGSTYGQIRESLEFNLKEYQELQDHAQSVNLDFIVTPFDLKAFEFLDPLKLEAYKIASHSVRNLDLISAISKSDRPIIMSTGMSTIQEIDVAVELIRSNRGIFSDTKKINAKTHVLDLYLMHCISSYPTIDEDVNLRVINFLRDRYSLPIGYSGHEIDDLPTMISVAFGAQIIERHITISRQFEGFDHKLSLEESELKFLIEKIRRIRKIMGSTEKRLLDSELIAREKYNVSMVSARKIFKGEVVGLNDIKWKNPGTGINRAERDKYIGKKARKNIDDDVLIFPEMLE
jgi:sialic acid synthase SpsE